MNGRASRGSNTMRSAFNGAPSPSADGSRTKRGKMRSAAALARTTL
jgi:hypothetical protein